jgi:hypothetical protein
MKYKLVERKNPQNPQARPVGFVIRQSLVSGFVIRPAGFAIPQLQVSEFVIRFFSLQIQIRQDGGDSMDWHGLQIRARSVKNPDCFASSQ